MLLIVLSLLAFFLLMPVFVEVIIADEVKITVSYLFVKKQVNKKENPVSNPTESADEDKKEKKKKKKQKKNYVRELIEEKGLAAAISDIIFLLKSAFKRVLWVLGKFRVVKFRLDICVADNDAATAAIHYGGVCAVVYPALGFLHSCLTFKCKENIGVFCKYDNSESKIDLHAKLYILPINVIFAVCSFLFSYLFNFNKKTKDGASNG